MDHAVPTCLAESCGSRDDNLSWNLSRVKQGDAIQVRQHGSTGSGRAGIVKGADQTQGWVSSSDEHADGRDEQRSDSYIGGERCGSRCVHFQKPDVLKLDGPTEDLLEVSSQDEDLRVWATYIGIPVVPTSWLDVSEEDVKGSEYRSRLSRKVVKRRYRTVSRMFVLMRSLYGAQMTIALRSTNDCAQLGKRSGRMCSLRRISRLAFGRPKSCVVVNATCVDLFTKMTSLRIRSSGHGRSPSLMRKGSFLERFPHIAECASENVFHVQFPLSTASESESEQ